MNDDLKDKNEPDFENDQLDKALAGDKDQSQLEDNDSLAANDQAEGAVDSSQAEPEAEEELPAKSQAELELERVESIENLSLATGEPQGDDSNKADLSKEIESVLADEPSDKPASSTKDAKSDTSLRAGDLPVAHPEDNQKKVSLEDIIKNQKTEKKATKKPVIWMVLTVLLLFVAGGLGGLYYLSLDEHSRQQAKLQSELDSQKLSQAKLQKDLQSVKADQATQDKQANQAEKFNSIVEWAVKYPQDQSTADLTYSYSLYTVGQTEVERLSFSTTAISAIKQPTGQSVAYVCDSTKAPVGWIDRFEVAELAALKKSVAETPMAEAYNEVNLVKLGDYYFMTGTPQNACSEQLTSTNYADKLKVVQALPKKFVAEQQ